MKVFKTFAVSNDKAEEGAWMPLPEGARIKVRRFKSKHSIKVRKELEAPYRLVDKTGDLPEDVADDISNKHVAWGLIADWEGFTDNDDNVFPYSEDNALVLVESVPELRDLIANFSLDMSNYRDKAEDAVRGN